MNCISHTPLFTICFETSTPKSKKNRKLSFSIRFETSTPKLKKRKLCFSIHFGTSTPNRRNGNYVSVSILELTPQIEKQSYVSLLFMELPFLGWRENWMAKTKCEIWNSDVDFFDFKTKMNTFYIVKKERSQYFYP